MRQREAMLARYRAQVLHGRDAAPARKFNEPDPSVPRTRRRRKERPAAPRQGERVVAEEWTDERIAVVKQDPEWWSM